MAEQAFVNADGVGENNEAQAGNMALIMLAGSEQLMRGASTGEAIGAAVRQLNGAESTPAYQAQTNRPAVYGDNADVPRVVPQFGSIASVLGTLTGTAPGAVLNKTCEAILSPAGLGAVAGIDIIGQTVIGLLTGGSGAVAEQGSLRLISLNVIEQLGKATWHTATGLVKPKGLLTLGGISLYALGLHVAAGALAGTNFFGAEQGGPYWERVTAGTVAVQDAQVRSIGGVPLPPDQAQTVDGEYHALLQADMQKKNYFARYFAPDNPTSLTGLAIDKTPSSVSGVAASLTGGFGKIGSLFQLKTLTNWGLGFSGATKTYAQTMGYDPYYGQVQKGFTPAELDKMRNDPSYSIAENEDHIGPAEISSLDGTIGKCFDPSRSEYSVNKDPDCTADKLTTDQAFRYRIYKFLDERIVLDSEDDLAHPTPSNTANQGGN
jgi:hypothetical protein